METQTRRRSRLSIVVISLAAVGLIAFGPITSYVKGDAAADAKMKPAMKLASLGMKFNGAASCKGSGCHNKAGADAPPKEREHEFNIWKEADKHSKAFDTLKEAASKDIGTKMKIADVSKSDKCLSCHALNVPAAVQGKDFSIKEGNTCESCHGPSEKWLKDHAKKGWQDETRKKMSHDQMLTTLGLYDTRPLVVRAEMCASCHLSIDADMVAAGHPQPTFEMAYYSDIEPKHWIDAEGFFNAQVWAAGQVVCVREAMEQLSDRVKAKAPQDAIASAWQQALAHASVFEPAAAVAGMNDYKAHVDALAALKPADGDKIAAEADAIAKICEAGKAKFADWKADAASTGKLLSEVAGMTGLATKYGHFGMDQQRMAIASLFTGMTTGSGKADEATNKLINDKLFPEKDPAEADFDKLVGEVKAKLPK